MSDLAPGLEPTLGELLAVAFQRSEPEPVSFERSRYVAALSLSAQLAPVFTVTSEDVFDALCTVPDNMLVLLESPEGWTALAGYIAADFGVPVVTYRPTIH